MSKDPIEQNIKDMEDSSRFESESFRKVDLRVSHSRDSGFGGFLVLFGAGCGAFLASPGLLLAFGAARVLGLGWDTGQHWVAGVSAATVLFALLWLLCGFWRGLAAYGGVCALCLWGFCVARWGMKAVWACAFLSQIIGWNG